MAMVFFTPQKGEVSAHAPAKKGGDAYQVIALVNSVRAAYGLADYVANSALMSAAQAHSEYQASIGSATHTGNGGSRAGDRAIAAGYGGGAKVYVTENIYSGRSATASIAVNWWQGDSVHLNTMISPSYTDVGVGVAEANGVTYYTMDVGYIAGAAGQGSNSKSSSGSSSGSSNDSAAVIVPIVAATPQADGSIIHTVKEGQALWNIAAIYNITVDNLLALNGLTENSFIHPGDQVLVQAATTITATQTLSATQSLAISTTTIPIPVTQTATAVVVPTDTQAPISIQSPSETPSDMVLLESPQPTIIVMIEGDAPSSPKIDPVLLAIGALVVIGIFLVFLGSFTRKAS
ncbi:MAG: LysM peptidoglycan-binding domain-containing protein [Anaerolineales bacterium]|nr:LysM peptidoglycan-binding domain-containing protein [Anaerolineales bacterium]